MKVIKGDLGAISGLLFDVGAGKITLDQNWEKDWQFEKEKRVACTTETTFVSDQYLHWTQVYNF